MHSTPGAASAKIQRMLDQAVSNGSESAVQVAAYLGGEMIVDAWAAPKSRAVDGRTLFPFFSTGKGIAATAVHRLVERGVLSWDDPIARYWPEFAAQGKGGITLRHALNHTAGLPMMPETREMIRGDVWGAMCAYLAAAAPLHQPGARRHYHAITYSWLVGETARRADGRDFCRIIAEEVCRPLGIDTLFFGMPAGMRPRCVDAEKALPVETPQPPAPPPPPDPVAQRAIPAWVCPLEDWINRDDVRRACIPASNGFGNARAIARHYAALMGNGVDGVRLLADATIAAATRWEDADAAVQGAGRWGLGYGLQGPDNAPGVVFGHGGYGGSTGFADARYGLAVGIVKSRMFGTLTDQVIEAIRRCVGAA
ncbi:beta-lactamase family protein [bacterium]|nr:beta-lactamase family protein [bacterium]